MTTILQNDRYRRGFVKFVKNDLKRAHQLKKILKLLLQDPQHPGLNMEKLKGSKIYTARINKGDRLFFQWISDSTILLIDIGPHDKYRDY